MSEAPLSAPDETAWLIEETWSGYVHYVHRDFDAEKWRSEAERIREISRRHQPFITKNVDEAMRFPTQEAAETWMKKQPRWITHSDQFQAREHMWPEAPLSRLNATDVFEAFEASLVEGTPTLSLQNGRIWINGEDAFDARRFIEALYAVEIERVRAVSRSQPSGSRKGVIDGVSR